MVLLIADHAFICTCAVGFNHQWTIGAIRRIGIKANTRLYKRPFYKNNQVLFLLFVSIFFYLLVEKSMYPRFVKF